MFYANIADLTELDRVARAIIADWFDREPRTIKSGMIDGDYLPIRGDDDEQRETRADILREHMGVRVEERARSG